MKRKSNLLIILGILLLINSLVYFVYLKTEENKKRQEAIETENEFLKQVESKKNEKYVLDFTKLRDKKPEEKGDEITNTEAIGVIRIDKLGVLAEVYNNTEYNTLLKGVGVIETTDFPSSKSGTTSALAGHRGGRNEKLSFLNIHKLEAGDEIKLTTKDEILIYRVVEQEVVEADDWSKFTREDDKSKLILMACHPYPQNYQRLLIKAELIKDTEVNVNEIEH